MTAIHRCREVRGSNDVAYQACVVLHGCYLRDPNGGRLGWIKGSARWVATSPQKSTADPELPDGWPSARGASPPPPECRAWPVRGNSRCPRPRTADDVDLVARVTGRHVEPLVQGLEREFYVDANMIRAAVDRRASFNLIVERARRPHAPLVGSGRRPSPRALSSQPGDRLRRALPVSFRQGRVPCRRDHLGVLGAGTAGERIFERSIRAG